MTAFDELLKAAFNAGANHEHEPSNPDFDEWRESISGLAIEPDLGPIRKGDIIEITTNDPLFDEVRGRHYRVSAVSNNFYYFDWDGDRWSIPLTSARKVIPGRSS